MRIKPLESYVKAILVHFLVPVIRSAVGFVTQNLRTTAGGSGTGIPKRSWLLAGGNPPTVS